MLHYVTIVIYTYIHLCPHSINTLFTYHSCHPHSHSALTLIVENVKCLKVVEAINTYTHSLNFSHTNAYIHSYIPISTPNYYHFNATLYPNSFPKLIPSNHFQFNFLNFNSFILIPEYIS